MKELCDRVADCLSGLTGEKLTLMPMVSGGADSIALLLATTAAAARLSLPVIAFHAEHGLRGESGREDARFVEALCQRLGVPLCSVSLALDPAQSGVEARAREARYRAAVQAAKAHGAVLLTAHHQDDQAETVLLHLVRGGGTQGLCGMRERASVYGAMVLRPFLQMPKEQLIAPLEKMGQEYRTDETNVMPFCQRNRLRLEVMPLFQALNQNATRHIAQAAQCLQADEDCLCEMAEALLAKAEAVGYPAVWLAPLVTAPEAVRRRALRAFYGRYGAADEALSYEDTLALSELALVGRAQGINLPDSLFTKRGHTHLYLLRQDGAPLTLPPAPPEIRLVPNGAPANGKTRLTLPEAIYRGAAVRAARPDDTLHPFGMEGHKSLAKALSDAGVEPPFRAGFPVLARDNEILWLMGVCASEETRVRTNEKCVTLEITQQLPWNRQESGEFGDAKR